MLSHKLMFEDTSVGSAVNYINILYTNYDLYDENGELVHASNDGSRI